MLEIIKHATEKVNRRKSSDVFIASVFRLFPRQQPVRVDAGLIQEIKQDFRGDRHSGLEVVPGSGRNVEPAGHLRAAVLAEEFFADFSQSRG